MSPWTSVTDHLVVHSIGLLALGVLALLLDRLWRRDPIESYGFHRALLYAVLALPLLQVGLAGRVGADAWIPLRQWWNGRSAAPLEARSSLATKPVAPPLAERLDARSEALDEARLARGRLAWRPRANPEPTVAVEPVPSPPEREPLAWGGLWASGALLVLGWHLLRLAATARMLARCEPVADPQVHAAWRKVARGSRLRERVRLLTGDHVHSPGCFGLLRPVLVVPRRAGAPEDREALECALLHELVHLERGDARVALLAAVARAAFWFHPVVWWITKQLERLRESSCDLAVVRRTGRPKSYALALLSYAVDAEDPTPLTGWSAARSACPTLLHWTHSPSQLRRRIEMLANQRPAPSRTQRILSFGLAAVALSSLWGGQLATAAALFPKDDEPTKAELGARIVALQARADDLMAELDELLATVADLTVDADTFELDVPLNFEVELEGDELGLERLNDEDAPHPPHDGDTDGAGEPVLGTSIAVETDGDEEPRIYTLNRGEGHAIDLDDLELDHDVFEIGNGATVIRCEDGGACEIRVRPSDEARDAKTFVYELKLGDGEDAHEHDGHGVFTWRSDAEGEEGDGDGPFVLRLGAGLQGLEHGEWSFELPDGAFAWKAGDGAAPELFHFDDAGSESAWITVPEPIQRGAPHRSRRRLGVTVERPGAALAGHLGLDTDDALVIASVEDGSPAARAGLEVHDVIVSIGGQERVGHGALLAAIAQAGPEPLKLELLRKGSPRKVVIEFDDERGRAKAEPKPRLFRLEKKAPKVLPKAKKFFLRATGPKTEPRRERLRQRIRLFRESQGEPPRARPRWHGDDGDLDVRAMLEKALRHVDDERVEAKIRQALERLDDRRRRRSKGAFFERTDGASDAPAPPAGRAITVVPRLAAPAPPVAAVPPVVTAPAPWAVETVPVPEIAPVAIEPIEGWEPIPLPPGEPSDAPEPIDVPEVVETPASPTAPEPRIDVTELVEQLELEPIEPR